MKNDNIKTSLEKAKQLINTTERILEKYDDNNYRLETGYFYCYQDLLKFKVTPDLKYVIKIFDSEVELLDCAEGKVARIFHEDDKILYGEVTIDNKYILYITEHGSLKLIHIFNEEVIYSIEGYSNISTSIKLTPDGRYFLIGYADGTIQLCTIYDGQIVYSIQGNMNRIDHIELVADGEYYISSSNDGEGGRAIPKLWNLKDGKEINSFTCLGSSHDFMYGNCWIYGAIGENLEGYEIFLYEDISHNYVDNVNKIFVGNLRHDPFAYYIPQCSRKSHHSFTDEVKDDTISVYDLNNDTIIKTFNVLYEGIQAVSPSGKLMAYATENLLRLWNTESHELDEEQIAIDSYYKNIEFTKDEKYIVIYDTDVTYIWDIEEKKEVRNISEDISNRIMSWYYKENGRFLCLNDERWNSTKILDTQNYKQLAWGTYSGKIITDNKKYIISDNSDRSNLVIEVREIKNNKLLRTFKLFRTFPKGLNDRLENIYISPKLNYLCVVIHNLVDYSKKLWILDIKNYREVSCIDIDIDDREKEPIIFSPDEQFIIIPGTKVLKLNANTADSYAEYGGLSQKVSPNGKYLYISVYGSIQNSKLLNIENAKEVDISALKKGGIINEISFSPNEKYLLLIHGDILDEEKSFDKKNNDEKWDFLSKLQCQSPSLYPGDKLYARILDIANNKIIFDIKIDDKNFLPSFSYNGKHFLHSFSNNEKYFLYTLNSNEQQLLNIETNEIIYSSNVDMFPEFSMNSRYLVYKDYVIDIENGNTIIKIVFFTDTEWIIYKENGDYNCSEGANKYFSFVNGIECMNEAHPIYKQKKKDKMLIDMNMINSEEFTIKEFTIEEDFELPF